MFKMYKHVIFLLLLVAVTSVVGPKNPKSKEDQVIEQLITEARQRKNSYTLVKAREELQRLTKIRIFIPDAPNFGHQSAAIALLDQLTDEVDLGYKGDIEIVYDIAVKKRLQTLRPGFEGLGGQIKFTVKESFNGKFEANGIAFTAGSESGCNEQEMKSLLDLMKVPFGISLQPYAWLGGKRCLARKESFKENGKVIWEEPDLPESSSYIYEVKVPSSLSVFFQHNVYSNEAVSESEEKKYKIIEHILSKVSDGVIELMVLYGIHQVYWERENVLVNMQGGIQQAELDKPSILLLFGKDILKPRAEGIVYSIDDIEKPAMIDRFVKGKGNGRQITILAGNAIQPVFHLACKLSTLPMVFEGANTANLAYLLEKPFISVKDQYTPLPTVKETTGREMLKDLVDHVKDDISWTTRYHQLEKYAKMLINLRRARHHLDSNKDVSQNINVVKNVVDYVTPSVDKVEVLNNFIDQLKAKCNTIPGVAKKIFPEEFSNFYGVGIGEVSVKNEEVMKDLKTNIIFYRAEFRRATGLRKLTSDAISSEEIFQPPSIAETEEEQDKGEAEIEEIALGLKKLEASVLQNSLKEFLEEVDVMMEVKAKFELEPSAKAANLVKDIVVQSKIKDSKLNQYYEEVFEIPKKLENNQLVQSLYHISTMPTPEREKLVKCVAFKLYTVNVRLQNFEKDAKKLRVSRATKFMVKSRNKEYNILTQDKKGFRERLFMLSELENGMVATLSAVIDELKAKMKKEKTTMDKATKQDVNAYSSGSTALMKEAEEWVKRLDNWFGPGPGPECKMTK